MKIAIVGGSPTAKHAPFKDPSWEIWSVGKSSRAHPRVSRVFEIHEKLAEVPEGYYEYLAALPCPVITGENSPLKADNAKVFPFADAAKLFGRQYLTSTCAYMAAMAILEGATEIAVFGVDMAVDDNEYFFERPCMEAWLGFARGRGIKIGMPASCPILKSQFVYGADERQSGEFTQAEFETLAARHLEKIEQIKGRIHELEAEMHTHNGSYQSYTALAKVARAIEAGQDIKKLSDQIFER